ncbi:hypothetical protein LTR37_004083 [Vermiconidia calcicola]|uniref:Uncharacterized protein n=1 Tax=Vermiconidia calcicola TaxID=1690605 RepID=A0ACC3NNJ8_9PEZI|nr:hypothetical protein LTR37_004083 [Vermiconidia calcicola]
MAYSDDAVKAKLSALNETQDSIVTVAQWIMFHRRHADKTASLWLARMQECNMPKRLNLVYLANEVVQQSRARGKQDFLLAFEPLISEATSLAYKNASQEVQGKLKRVVEVWRQRNIFDPRIQETIEQRLDELDKQRGTAANGGGSRGRLGGALFGGGGSGSVPAELDGISKSQANLSKAEASVKPAVDSANTEYAKMTDPNTPLPTPPVHAARLSALMKNLATAQGAVEASVNARKELIAGLEKLVENNRAKLAEDETTAADLATRREGVEAKKREVEDGIMRGLSTPSSPGIPTPAAANGLSPTNSRGFERPETEGFTPPPPDVESFTPPPQEETMTGDPAPLLGEDTPAERSFTSTTGAEDIHEQPPQLTEPAPAFEPPPALQTAESASAAAANDFLNSLNIGQVRQASAEIPAAATTGDPRLKRRKMSHKSSEDVDADIFGGMNGAGGVDEDGISAMLGS